MAVYTICWVARQFELVSHLGPVIAGGSAAALEKASAGRGLECDAGAKLSIMVEIAGRPREWRRACRKLCGSRPLFVTQAA